MTTALVTGASGAIGAHMLAHLLENTDWLIVATDSFRHKGYFDRLTAIADDYVDFHERVTVLPHDLTVPFTGREIEKIGRVDHVIHLASLSDVQASIDDPVPFIRNNVDITLNMLEFARVAKPQTFIMFSTDEVYGPDTADGTGHPEWDVILPSNPYSASKAAQEAIAIAYWRSYGVPVIITNTMNNFGEMQDASKYTAMLQKRLQAGETVTVHAASDGQIGSRYYLHSRDAADAVLFILRNTTPTLHQPGELDRPDRYNIVGDAQINNLELAEIVSDLLGLPLDVEMVDFHSEQPGHDLHYGLDGSKLFALGWKAPLGFDAGMKRTIAWQQEHPEWMR